MASASTSASAPSADLDEEVGQVGARLLEVRFGGDHQNPPDDRDQPEEQERLDQDPVAPVHQAQRVEQLGRGTRPHPRRRDVRRALGGPSMLADKSDAARAAAAATVACAGTSRRVSSTTCSRSSRPTAARFSSRPERGSTPRDGCGTGGRRRARRRAGLRRGPGRTRPHLHQAGHIGEREQSHQPPVAADE